MDQYYYLTDDNTPSGPMSADAIITHVSSQKLSLDSLIAQEGSTEWKPLRTLLPKLIAQEEDLPPVPKKASTPTPLLQTTRQDILVNSHSLNRTEKRELKEINKGTRRESDGKKYFFGKKVTWEGVNVFAIAIAIGCGRLAYKQSVILWIALAIVLIPLVYGIGWLLIKHYDDI